MSKVTRLFKEYREGGMEQVQEKISQKIFERLMHTVRQEYTVMPRFGFHQPMDYHLVTLPPEFERVEIDPASGLAVPTGKDRFGYSPEDTKKYLDWGKYDHDQLVEVAKKYGVYNEGAKILDFGCSSGRVLRHFEEEHKTQKWNLYGCDIQALCVQWMREYLPNHFNVINSSTLPHLPYEDNTFDFIYGFSVFTHIKFQWDAWLMELRRIMKPGGVLMQTIHTENAWTHYNKHKNEGWVIENHTPRVYNTPEMDVDFLLHGDVCVSQVFWKKEIAKQYWARYFDVLELREPPAYSFQDWMICRK